MREEWKARIAEAKENVKKVPRRYLMIALAVMAVVVVVAVLRIQDAIVLREETAANAITTVATIKAAHGPVTEVLTLPANVVAWHEATIYARTNGYVRQWYVDIGDRVKEGDLLAEIETPEVDQQLRQTQADLKTAEANDAIAQITAQRWIKLLKTNSVSRQDRDEKVSAAQASAAIVKSMRANRDRLQDLVNFKRVIAPFDGIISDRRTDIGALINAGRNTFPALFHIVQVNPLRIYVKIPQYYAPRITPGMTASIEFTERPGNTYPVKLVQMADAIDPVTRTLLAQFVIDNTNYEILPGGYTQINLKIILPGQIVRLPVNTLVFNAKGLQIAVVTEENKISLKPITISRDFGNVIEVSSGITEGEQVIIDPPDSLFTGQTVRVTKRMDDFA